MNDKSSPGLPKLIGAIFLLQVLDAFCFPITRYGTQIIEPFTFAFYRYLISSVVLLLIVRARKSQMPVKRKDWWRIVVLAILIIPGNQTLYVLGQSMTSAGHGAFLFASGPVWMFILAIIHLKEKLRIRRVIGILIAFGGVLVLVLGDGIQYDAESLKGDLLIVISVMAWSYYTILGKRLVQQYGALRMTAYALAIGAAIYAPFGAYRAYVFDYSAVTWGAWGAVLFMALGMSVGLYVLWYWLVKHMDISRLAIWHNFYPVMAAVVAFFALGEPLTGMFVLGGIAVLGGVIAAESGKH